MAETKTSHAPPLVEDDDPELTGLILGVEFKRAEERAERDYGRARLAETAREVAAHLQTLASRIELEPLNVEDFNRYAKQIEAAAEVTPARAKLPKRRVKWAHEPWTLPELERGWAFPLRSAWASWTQVFNQPEFTADREAMLAVTRTLKAVAFAFWPDGLDAPTKRSAEDADLLSRLGTLCGRYLRRGRDEDLVEARPWAAQRLVWHLAQSLRRPFFIWSASDRAELFRRRDPSDDEIAEVSERTAAWLVSTLRDGYALSDVRSDLPEDFAAPEHMAALVEEVCAHYRQFDPGPSAFDDGPAVEGARSILKAAMRTLGYPRNKVKSLFDTHRKGTRDEGSGK